MNDVLTAKIRELDQVGALQRAAAADLNKLNNQRLAVLEEAGKMFRAWFLEQLPEVRNLVRRISHEERLP